MADTEKTKYNAYQIGSAYEQSKQSKDIISAAYWNEIFNIHRAQGNADDTYIGQIFNYLFDNSVGIDTTLTNQFGALQTQATTTQTTLSSHTSNTNNPHSVIASQVNITTISELTGTEVQTALQSLKTLDAAKLTISAASNTYETIASANSLIKNVSFTSSDGKFTFTKQDDSTIIIDTALEKVPASMDLVENPVGSGTYYLVVTNIDGSTTSCPVSTLFNEITVADTDRVDLTLTTLSSGKKQLSADIKAGSITSTQIDPTYMTTINTAVSNALSYKNAAESAASNASDYKDTTSGYMTTTEGYKNTTSGYMSTTEGFKNSASTSASTATTQAGYASTYATNSSNSAVTSQSWAVGGTGTRTGEDTNNAHYWCQQAQEAVQRHYVTSVNGVSPTGTGPGPITIDPDDLDDTSTTNKFVTSTDKTTWNNKQNALTFDTTPTSGSTNPVTSGGVYNAIPTVNNATLTIQKNGTAVSTFTANASTDVTCNITVPTTTSGLTNDSGFITSSYHDSTKANKSTLYTGTLLSSGWSNNTQTLTISGLATSGFSYVVAPASTSFSDWADSVIYADDITTADTITFHCTTTPTSAISVQILKVQI